MLTIYLATVRSRSCSRQPLVPLLVLSTAFGLICCQGETVDATTQESTVSALAATEQDPLADRHFAVNSVALQQDFTTWWNYTYYHVKLSQDFVGLDVDSTLLEKPAFLARLTSGQVVPFKLLIRDGVTYYKLYPINKSEPAIEATIRQQADSELAHLAQEGKPLPAYQFTDIQGNAYSPATTKGKVLVLKCWYISCVACVQEFPAVNELADAYKDRDDILFLSLAFDDQEALSKFLQRHELHYATVPHMKEFMMDQLGINSYPTHLLVDRGGNIVKVVDRVDELKPFLAQQAVVLP